MIIKNSEFLTSVAGRDYKDYDAPEFAFVGKSNVGKSSLLNYVVNRKSLALTSGTPGKTRLINYFSINNKELIFVDLPGYGFARVSDEQKEKWKDILTHYFTESRNLRMVFVLVDSRHEPGQNDLQMIAFLRHYSIPFIVIATKCDKLTRNELYKNKKMISSKLAMGEGNIIFVSANKKIGRDLILDKIDEALKADEELDGLDLEIEEE